jgi:hypothetical protein
MRRFTNHHLRPREEVKETNKKTNPTFKLTQSGEEGKSRQLFSRPPLRFSKEDTHTHTNDGNNQRSPGVATTQKITRFFIIFGFLLFSWAGRSIQKAAIVAKK